MNAIITFVLVTCAAAAGCTPARSADPIPAKAACESGVVTVWDGQPTPCDLTPPQQLDILLDVVDEDATEAERQCDEMGGSVTWDDDLPAWRCQGVDY